MIENNWIVLSQKRPLEEGHSSWVLKDAKGIDVGEPRRVREQVQRPRRTGRGDSRKWEECAIWQVSPGVTCILLCDKLQEWPKRLWWHWTFLWFQFGPHFKSIGFNCENPFCLMSEYSPKVVCHVLCFDFYKGGWLKSACNGTEAF